MSEETINIIDVKKVRLDPLTSSIGELEDALKHLPELKLYKHAIISLAEYLQSPMRIFFLDTSVENVSDSILAREALKYPSVYAIVGTSGIQTRVSNLVHTKDQNGKQGYATAESMIQVSKFEMPIPHVNWSGHPFVNKYNFQSGSYTCLNAYGAVPPGLKITDPKTAILQLRDAVDTYMSFGGCYLLLKNALKVSIPKIETSIVHISDIPAPPNKIIKNLFDKIKQTDTIAFNTTYSSNTIYDAVRVDALVPYISSTLEGINSDHVKEWLEYAELRFKRETKLKMLNKKLNEALIKSNFIRIAIQEKFGEKRLLSIRKSQNPEDILLQLNATERKIVSIEVESKENSWNAFVTNKCAHVSILSDLTTAINLSRTKDYLKQLQIYMRDPKSENDWINCGECGHRIICPHVREKLTMEINETPYHTLKASLRKYETKAQFKSNYYSFCKICGEKISEYIPFDANSASDTLGKYGNLDTGLKSRIWNTILNVSKYFRFSSPTDPKKIANLFTPTVYDVLLDIEDQSTKKGKRRYKQNLIDENFIDARTQMNMILLVFAQFLRLYQVKNGEDVLLEGIKKETKLTVVADKIMKIFINDNYTLISQFEDITPDYLKAKFVELFKRVSEERVPEIHSVNLVEELAIQIVVFNPLYKFMVTIAKICKSIPIERATSVSAAKQEFETVMGISIPNIIKKSKDTMTNPAYKEIYEKKSGYSLTGSISTKIKDLNLFYDMYKLPTHGGKKQTSDDISSLMTAALLGGYKLMYDYTHGTLTDTAIQKYKIEETKLRKIVSTYASSPHFDYGYKKTQQYKHTTVQLSDIYDENGKYHIWNIYYYLVGKNDILTIDISSEKILKYIENGKLKNAKLIDVGCSLCGIKQSKTNTLDASLVKKSTLSVNEITSFYLLYDYRCPESDVHIYSPSGSCTKCGFIKATVDKAYFDKYYSNYLVDKKQAFVIETTTQSTTSSYAAPDREFSYENVAKVAKLLGVSISLIESIGNTSGRDYTDILEEKNIPPNPHSISDNRIYSIDAEIRMFLTHWNMFKMGTVLDHLNDVSAADLKDVPEIGGNYADVVFEYVLNTVSVDTILGYLVSVLCTYCIDIIDATKQDTFVKKEMELILRNQKLFSKPGTFDWALFERGDEYFNSLDDIVPEQIGDVGEDVVERDGINYSFADIDVEKSNLYSNLEPE